MTRTPTAYPRVIGLYSPYPGAGKTTVANYLAIEGYTRISFAYPLRRMVKVLLTSLGYAPESAEALLTTGKEITLPELGVTPRHLLRTLGTEWGRDCVHPDLWLKAWQSNADAILRADGLVVCDDMRFPNEMDLLGSFPNSQLWRITRPEVAPLSPPTHRSDGHLDDFVFDAEIVNTKTLGDLHARIDELLRS